MFLTTHEYKPASERLRTLVTKSPASESELVFCTADKQYHQFIIIVISGIYLMRYFQKGAGGKGMCICDK